MSQVPPAAAESTPPGYLLCSYGLYSYGLYIHGLYSYGLYIHGLYSHGLQVLLVPDSCCGAVSDYTEGAVRTLCCLVTVTRLSKDLPCHETHHTSVLVYQSSF